MDRLNFIKKSLLVFIGTAIIPTTMFSSFHIRKKVIFISPTPIWPVIIQFARQIGYGVITSLIASYLKEYIDDEFKETIKSSNNIIKDKGYAIPEKTEIYSGHSNKNPSNYKETVKDDTIFHVAQKKEIESDSIVVFHSMKTYRSTIIKWPSLLVLTQATKDFKVKHNSTMREMKRVFLPINSIQKAKGNYFMGYEKPDIYQTELGSVEIQYYSSGNGFGTARIIVKKQNSIIFDTSYDMGYNN